MWTFKLASALVLAGLAGGQQSSSNNSSLNFGPVVFGGYNNYVIRDNTTSAQVVITQGSNFSSPTRFITAFPNGNTGTLIYLVPNPAVNSSLNVTNSTNNQSTALGATLLNGTLQTFSGDYNQTGITGQLSVSSDFRFGVTIIGGVRAIRDYTESGGTVFNSIFNYTLGPYNATSVQLIRQWINGTTTQYLTFNADYNGNFTVLPSSNTTLPPNITFTRPNSGANGTVRFTTSFNFTGTTPSTPFVPLQGLGREQLFLTSIPVGGNTTTANANTTVNLVNTLSAIQSNATAIADQLAFLAYSTKFLAGGWRFLTYFGRDTLLALRLLLPVVSQTTAEAILGAVIERTNDTGRADGPALCHEETIGDYASFININNNQSQLGNEPSYSYVMVDTDFLLIPVLADYFLATPQGSGRAANFLNQTSTLKNGTFAQLLQKNVDHVLDLSKPFAESPSQSNLVRIRDPLVGDWRDSAAGLGYGIFPFDVNAALVPAALRGIAQLASAGIIRSNYTDLAAVYANIWESQSSQYFQFNVSSGNATTDLNNYVAAANLSSTLLYGAGSLNSTNSTGASNGNTTSVGSGGGNITNSRAWSAKGQTIGSNGTSTLYGVSINANGSVVQIQNSDLGFVLNYANNVPSSIIQATIEALQPYPRGLLTNVGMVVANAAYDTNRTNIQVFSNLAYHGAVSWSWQQGLMASGISRQLGLCSLSASTQLEPVPPGTTRPSWCNNTDLTTALTQAQYRLWDSIVGSAPALYTEVLSPVWSNSSNMFSIGDLGALSPEGTEGDAIQLWSYGFLGLIDPRTGKPVAGGFS